MLERGHEGDHICDFSIDVDGNLRPHRDAPGADTVNVGRAPYYGPQTLFYGENTADAPQLVEAGQDGTYRTHDQAPERGFCVRS
jgi:hypothetical protein